MPFRKIIPNCEWTGPHHHYHYMHHARAVSDGIRLQVHCSGLITTLPFDLAAHGPGC